MSLHVLVYLALVAVGAWMLLAASAQAATVTVGSSLTGSFTPSSAEVTPYLGIDSALADPNAHVLSPVSGVIVRWHLIDAAGSDFKLRVMRPAGGTSYTSTGTSAPVSPSGTGNETFPTDLPIAAGETVGLDVPPGATEGLAPGGGTNYWQPPLAEGATGPFTSGFPKEYGFNADVQPLPGITAISPSSGSIKGGTSVTITGTDFAGVSAVKFGSAAASSFTVNSETQITAVASPSATPGAVDTSATTATGTTATSAADQFTYTAAPAIAACAVPKLKGKKLKSAKKKLKAGDCKFGKVKKLKGATTKTGKVKKQSPKPGKILAPGAKVSVKLG